MIDDGKFVCDNCKKPLQLASIDIIRGVGILVADCPPCRTRYEITFHVIMASEMKYKDEDYADLEA